LTISTSSGLVEELRRRGVDILDDPGTQSMYATDASVYRIAPLAVARPRHAEDVAILLEVARAYRVPLTARGAGTSVAGNAVGPGLVIDFSRHFNRVLSVDAETRSAVVEPGVVHATLQRAAAELKLRFGPDPSTHTRCTIGGMIGNNACGSRSLAYGRTSDNVLGLDMLTVEGELIRTGPDGHVEMPGTLRESLTRLIGADLGTVRTEFGRFPRQVSGYAVEHLLPERFDATRALVGSEGTLGLITRATVKLVDDVPCRVMVVLGFETIVDAANAAPGVVSHGPTACEGLDSRIVQVVRSRRGDSAVPDLPAGGAWLFVELAGTSTDETRGRAQELVASTLAPSAAVIFDPTHQARLWRIREDGAGLAGRAPSGAPAWPGWEDAAVPPASLGSYLARFDALVADHGLTSAPFGHFGEGCMHVRLDFPLHRTDGRARFRSFLEDAADLVAEYGGSLSGEHGDGRARSELLPRMYSPRAIRLFAALKAAFDPDGLLNPGVLVDPAPMDADMRIVGLAPLTGAQHGSLGFRYESDNGDLAMAVHRCTGVGKCRADNSAAGGVMCPSYLATREEKDSTRGRARILQDVVTGNLDWRDSSVHDALDLCLSCKGCASDCPTGIDMATYKSEVLHQSYRRRRRPRSHYTLGWLPRWMRIASRFPRLSNTLLSLPLLGPAAYWTAGVDRRRGLPRFASRTFTSHWRETTQGTSAGRQPIVLFVDSFSNAFSPEAADAVVLTLRSAGYEPRVLDQHLCCGLTWITTGQLGAAKRILTRTVEALVAEVRAGCLIVGIEPSCTAVIRSDAEELLGTAAAKEVAAATRTLSEVLLAASSSGTWRVPDLRDTVVIAQPHCHHRAVLGWEADRELLAQTGAVVQELGGCCGLAGNFGVELGHYDVSVKVAQQNLLPAVDDRPDAVVLADGFSCRTQLDDLRSRQAIHLAQLLAGR
jgi:FAD/FMN-containing dehydrogenase/Fe-S oxidoreductase